MAADDPLLSYFGHPLLHTGYNSWDINGDSYDGSGVNEPIWPELFDSFIGLEILLITEDMLAFFADELPDIVFPCNDDTAMVKAGYRGKVISPEVNQVPVLVEGSTLGIAPGRIAFNPEKPPSGALIKRQSGTVPIKTRTVTVTVRRGK